MSVCMYVHMCSCVCVGGCSCQSTRKIWAREFWSIRERGSITIHLHIKRLVFFNTSSNFSFYITSVQYVALQFFPSSWHLRIKIKYNTGAGCSVGRWEWLLAHIESWGSCTMQSIKSVFSLSFSVCSCLVKIPQRVGLYLPAETMLSRLTSLDGRPGEKLLRLL